MAAAIVLAVLVPLILSALGTAVVRAFARRHGYVDRPGGHKRHDRPVALGGGVAITAAVVVPLGVVCAAALLLSPESLPESAPALVGTHIEGLSESAPRLLLILAGAVVLHILGLVDDFRHLGPGVKFLVQFLVSGVLATVGEVRLMEMLPPPVSIGLSVLWMVLIINAFNFMDNMDGLCAGVAAIAGAIFAASALLAGQLFVPLTALVLVGALLGYLPFNFHPASIYMGDAGSLVIGYLLAVLTVLTTFFDPDQGMRPFGVLVPVVVLAVPLYDVLSVCRIRLKAGDSIFRGDTRHFSHRLVQRGMSVRVAVMTIYLATAATAMSALILPHASWPYAAVVFGQCFCVVLIIALLETGIEGFRD